MVSMKQDEQEHRREAMAAIREALKRDGRTQVWAARRLSDVTGVVVSRYAISNYLTGYRRIPRHLLVELCAVAHIPVERVRARISDESVLLLQRPAPERRKTADVA